MFHVDSDLRQGLIFGVNSGVITTGVLAGLVQTPVSPLVIVTVVSLAVSGIAESYGLFISKKVEEPEDNSKGPVKSLFGLLFTKMVVVLSFLIPLLFSKTGIL